MENNLKQLRKNNGLTQVELSTLLGVSRQTVISIESGRYDPSLPLAFKIGTVLDMPLEQIFIYSSSNTSNEE